MKLNKGRLEHFLRSHNAYLLASDISKTSESCGIYTTLICTCQSTHQETDYNSKKVTKDDATSIIRNMKAKDETPPKPKLLVFSDGWHIQLKTENAFGVSALGEDGLVQ